MDRQEYGLAKQRPGPEQFTHKADNQKDQRIAQPIAQSIERIAQMSEQNHTATSDSLARADELHALGEALENTVGRFRLAR